MLSRDTNFIRGLLLRKKEYFTLILVLKTINNGILMVHRILKQTEKHMSLYIQIISMEIPPRLLYITILNS